MRKILLVLLALLAIRLIPRALRTEARVIALLAMLTSAMSAMATANTSMTYNLTQRASALETRTGNLEQGQIPNVQPGSTIGTMQSAVSTMQDGNFSSITTSGDITVGGTCGVHGNLYVDGLGDVTGTMTVGSTCGVNGNLYVTGGTTLSTTQTGTLTTEGPCGVNGNLNYTGTLNHV